MVRSLKAWLALFVLLAAFAALAAFVSPFHNTAVQDDWDYARTVQILLQTGSFERSEIAQATEVSSALWGAAFAALFGFSFDTLRISTLVLSGLSLVLFFALLGELGFGVVQRALGAAALLVSPLFLFLSFSFMTDIPALACLLAALYCYVRALRQGNLRWALAGSLCAALGFLTRQLGLVSALAAAAYFFVRTPAPGALRTASRPTKREGSYASEGSPVPATRLDSIVRRRRAARAGVRPDDYTPSIFSRLTGMVRRRRAVLRPGENAQPLLQRRTFAPRLHARDYVPSPGERLRWAMACAALPLSVALLYTLWLSLAGGVTWANSQLTLGGTLEFVRDPQTPATVLRRIVADCMTLAVYALPLWLFLAPGLRGRRATSAALQPPRASASHSVERLKPLPQATDTRAVERFQPSPQATDTRAVERLRLPPPQGSDVRSVERPQPRPRTRDAHLVGRLMRAVPWWWLAALAVAVVFALTVLRLAQRGEYLPYLTDVVTRQGLRPYLAYFAYAGGSFRPDILPLPFWAALTLLGCAGGWALAMLALGRFRLPAAGRDSGAGFVYWSALCLAVPTLLFPEFYERFLLPFLPVTIILLLDARRRAAALPTNSNGAGRTLASLSLAAAGLLLMAGCSLGLLRDYWSWMDVRWPLAESIVAAGVPLQSLDGGYEWDGWKLYDQSMQVIRQRRLPMQITPWAYVINPQVMLAFAPLAGYHVSRVVQFDSPFGAEAGRFYVLEKD